MKSIFKKREMLYRRHGWTKVLFVVMFIIFLVFSVTYIYPLAWVLVNSLKDNGEFFRGNVAGLPWPVTFQNYATAFSTRDKTTGFNLFGMFGMTVAVSLVGTLVTVLTSSQAAYVLAKYRFRGAKLIYAIAIFAYICPVVGTLPAQVKFMDTLGLNDTFIGVIFLYSGGFGFNFILLHAFYKNLSWSYAEAAYIDGASDFQIYTQVMLPLSKGSLTAVFIIQLIGLWNDYTTPAIFLKSAPTLAVGINELTTTLKNGSQYTTMFAAMVVVLAPIILIFSLFSKIIMENTTVGGLKG